MELHETLTQNKPKKKKKKKRKEKEILHWPTWHLCWPSLSGSFFPLSVLFAHMMGLVFPFPSLWWFLWHWRVTPSIQKPVLINAGSILWLHVSICKLVSAGRNILDQIPERQLGERRPLGFGSMLATCIRPWASHLSAMYLLLVRWGKCVTWPVRHFVWCVISLYTRSLSMHWTPWGDWYVHPPRAGCIDSLSHSHVHTLRSCLVRTLGENTCSVRTLTQWECSSFHCLGQAMLFSCHNQLHISVASRAAQKSIIIVFFKQRPPQTPVTFQGRLPFETVQPSSSDRALGCSGRKKRGQLSPSD